jgi:hypothetical protein
MEMARLRGFRLLAVVGLVVGVSGCTSAAPASSAQVTEIHRQAQEALTHWDAAVASGAGGTGFVLVGESTLFVGSDWGPNIDGSNAKMALYAGLFVAATPLPSEAPPDGRIEWQDGTTHAVPVITAQQAFADMKAAGVSPCADCTPLQITGARLTTATFQSSRGPAQTPAWEFSLKDTDVKLDQVAVGGRITPPPGADQAAQTSVGPAVQSATVDASRMTLTVSVVGAEYGADKPCGADYTAEAVESDTAVVVIVYGHSNTLPAMCSDVGYFRTAQVTLAKPLGNRTLIDLQAQPISVTVGR